MKHVVQFVVLLIGVFLTGCNELHPLEPYPKSFYDPVQLISPTINEVLDNGCYDHSNPVEWYFDWADRKSAEKYQLYVIGPSGSAPLINKSDIDTSEYYFSDYGYISKNRIGWTWKVRVMVNGTWSVWSDIWTFDVEPIDTDCP